MSDIFISYARKDRAKAQLLADSFAKQGWGVWWDRDILPGESFDKVIEHELELSDCMVVLWSKTSVSSDWVKAEAAEALHRGVLIPIQIEEARIPLEFRRTQTANLIDWQGSPDDIEYRELLTAIAKTIRNKRAATAANQLAPPEELKNGAQVISPLPAPQPGEEEEVRLQDVPSHEREPANVAQPESATSTKLSTVSNVLFPSAVQREQEHKPKSIFAGWRLWIALTGIVLLVLSLGVAIIVWMVQRNSYRGYPSPTTGVNASDTAPSTSYPPVIPNNNTNNQTKVPKTNKNENSVPPGQPESSLPPTIQNGMGMEFVLIRPGSFTMGVNTDKPQETPEHKVTIHYQFYMSKFEVTQGQWQRVMGTTVKDQQAKDTSVTTEGRLIGTTITEQRLRDIQDARSSGANVSGRRAPARRSVTNQPRTVQPEGDNYPMSYVSWQEALDFVSALNRANDRYQYRLPSEAEWEYACRAGLPALTEGLQNMAWYSDNSNWTPHPVGMLRPNRFGLYDMVGNVQEWCVDPWHENYDGAPTDGSAWLTAGDSSMRVFRGGSFSNVANELGSHRRNKARYLSRSAYIGFRIVAVPRP